MENKANLAWAQIDVSSFLTNKYVGFCCFEGQKNKPNPKKGAINQVYQPVLIISIRSRGLKIKLRRKEAGKMARKVNTHIKAAVSLIINENLAAFRDFLFKIAYFFSKYVLRNHKPKRHNNSKPHNTVKASIKSQKKYQRIDWTVGFSVILCQGLIQRQPLG